MRKIPFNVTIVDREGDTTLHILSNKTDEYEQRIITSENKLKRPIMICIDEGSMDKAHVIGITINDAINIISELQRAIGVLKSEKDDE
jgi:hypothetical protein